MKCQICDTEQTIRSMAMHLKHNHNLKTDEYVQLHDEFRPKKLQELKKLKNSNIKCQLCHKEIMHNRQLMYHLTKEHPNITQEEYIVRYELNNIHPVCKCGCGGKTTFLRHGTNNENKTWFTEYIKGHWDWVKPGYNSHSKITRELMRESAKIRIQKEIQEKGYANMHNPKTLEERREIRKNISIERIERIHKVIILNKDEINSIQFCNNFKYKCQKCDFVWSQKTTCPRCVKCDPYDYSNTSKEEKEVLDFIQQNSNVEIINNSRKLIQPYEIDIYIPELKLGIEYDGLYWHCEIHKEDKKYHFNKFNLAEKNDIHLIQIFSDEWINKKDIVKSRLLNVLNKTPNKIYARNCEVIEIKNSKIKNKFLNKNHLQGEDKSKIKLGLYYKKELISLMTFGHPRKAIGMKFIKRENEWELIRFCNKLNTNVLGGASKLLKFFIKNYNPSHIYSFADNRWSPSNGNIYDKLGFKLTNKSLPGYWYTKNFIERIHRFNFNKEKLKNMGFETSTNTEHEIMNSVKYYKIWDCGITRYELNLE